MRFYQLLNLQHIWIFIFPTLLFIFVFGLLLYFAHFYTKNAEERKKTITYTFPDEIEDRNAPIPLGLILIFCGVIIWAFFYILVTGRTGMKI